MNDSFIFMKSFSYIHNRSVINGKAVAALPKLSDMLTLSQPGKGGGQTIMPTHWLCLALKNSLLNYAPAQENVTVLHNKHVSLESPIEKKLLYTINYVIP